MPENRHKLKDFARLTNLSRKALLLYEKKGLLVPEQVDGVTGYRYYGASQLRTASVLAFLRNFDVPLNDMKPIVEGQVSLGDYCNKRGTRSELVRQLTKTQHALQTIAACENGNGKFLSQELSVTVLPQRVALYSEAWGTARDVQLHFSLIARYMRQFSVSAGGAPFTLYLTDSTAGLLHFRACYPVAAHITTDHADIACGLFPQVKVASYRHFGDYANLAHAYAYLTESIKGQGWDWTREYLETYVVSGDTKYTDSSTFVTDVAGVLAWSSI